MSQTTETRMLTVQEAAAIMKVKPLTVRRWIYDGIVRAYQAKKGGHWRIPEEGLMAAMTSNDDSRTESR